MSPVLKLEGREQEGDWIGVMGSKENHMANLLCENDNKIISNYLMFFSKNAYELMKEVCFVLLSPQLARQGKIGKM